jgi:hypothetical protein
LKYAGNFSNDLLKHSTLLGGKHINFPGKHSFNLKNVLKNEELRLLNISD